MPLILNGTTGISGVDGSAGTPSYVGVDTDTGVLFPAANTLALSTGGTERVRVDSSGNVGIGTASPTAKLYINANNATATQILQDETNGAKLRCITNSINVDFGNSGGGGYLAVSGAWPLTFSTNSSERMRIDSSGNVGIGTSSPSSYYATQLVVNGGADGGITVVNTTTGDARLMFADGTAGDARYAGQIVYNHGNNYMMFGTNGGTERMRINSSGSLLLGTTDSIANITSSSGTGLALYNSSGNTQFLGTNANDTVAQLNRQGSNGELIVFRRDGNSIGNISGTTTGVTLVGTNGITFTATQTASAGANTLDDYEEGTWTPVIGGDAGTSGQSYSSQTGVYRKIGGFVYACFDVTLSAKGTITGTLTIAGFPFAASGTASVGNAGGPIVYWGSLATSWNMIGGHFGNGNTYMNLYGATGSGNTTTTALNTNDVNNTSRFMGFAVYPAS